MNGIDNIRPGRAWPTVPTRAGWREPPGAPGDSGVVTGRIDWGRRPILEAGCIEVSPAVDSSGVLSTSPKPVGKKPLTEPEVFAEEHPRPGQGHASLRHSPELILIVDDDPTVRHSLGEALQLENFAVRLAGDGCEAVRQFLEGPPDLILLDINMPDINGWQTFQIMSQIYPFVPVIVITASPGQSRRAAELGIDTLLEKPLHIPALLETMRRILARPETAHFGKVTHAWRTNDLPGTQE